MVQKAAKSLKIWMLVWYNWCCLNFYVDIWNDKMKMAWMLLDFVFWVGIMKVVETTLKQNLNYTYQIFIHHSYNYLCLFNSELFEQSGWNVWVRICWILPQFTSDLIQSRPLAGSCKIPQHYNSSQFDMIWLYYRHALQPTIDPFLNLYIGTLLLSSKQLSKLRMFISLKWQRTRKTICLSTHLVPRKFTETNNK